MSKQSFNSHSNERKLKYTQLAIADPAKLIFGLAPKPVKTHQGLVIGNGTVFPELNFTLPPMNVEHDTLPEVRAHYEEMIRSALRRAVELHLPGLVVEFETLPPMTQNPPWAAEVCKLLLDEMHAQRQKNGLNSVLRITPNDNRGMTRPMRLRSGKDWDTMIQTFILCAEAGAELLSIESLGGKEVFDQAVSRGDLAGVVFALCVLGVRDMEYLWKHITEIANTYKAIPAGDSACGFANTAMVLAEHKMLPRTFAAVVRAISAVRSLVAFECGAVGPGKDCAYENIYIKAITGLPMSSEGKSATCAHLSPIGNIAAAACDLWSNESVQNVRLLAAPAPTCFLESLAYDCRLMNEALRDGIDAARQLRDWLVRSDMRYDPQAVVLTPESAVQIASAIVAAEDHYHAGIAAARTALMLIREANRDGILTLPSTELQWLGRMERVLDQLPDNEDSFIALQIDRFRHLGLSLSEYGLQ